MINSGTEVSNDHHLVVIKMRIKRFYLYKKNKMKFDCPIDTDRLQKQKVQRKYSEQLRKEFEEIKDKKYTNVQEKWNDVVKAIVGCGKGILGTKTIL